MALSLNTPEWKKNAKWRPEPIKTKQDWQERLKNIRFGEKGVQEADRTDDTTLSFPIFDENMFLPSGSPMPKVAGTSGKALLEGGSDDEGASSEAQVREIV